MIVNTPSLAIADTGNNRVLVYTTPIGKTQDAAAVLGEDDFTGDSPNRGKGDHPTANTLNGPASVARDSAGNLYVADTGNDRVLIFRPPFGTGMNASVVIGQPGFTSATPLVGPDSTASSMGSPYSVAIDGKGNLWVADVSNERVLEYVPPFSNGMAAKLAIGQTSMDAATLCNGTPPTAKTLCSPEGIAFDAKGNLWIADVDSHRVLQYTPPFSTGMAASMELGQPVATAFTSGSSDGPSATSLAAPVALTFDPSGNLWVADYGFNRVLKYAPPFSNGMAAESVLGQADFTHGDANQSRTGPAADTLSGPWGLAFDSGGNLNVTERGNSRVLLFAPPLSNGMSASAVIGQTDFSAGAENRGSDSPTAKSLGQPFSLSAF
jgi:hypothetical protein